MLRSSTRLVWLDRKVGEDDVGVVFLSGHGVTDPSGDYYFVPYNAEIESPAGVTLPIRSTSRARHGNQSCPEAARWQCAVLIRYLPRRTGGGQRGDRL